MDFYAREGNFDQLLRWGSRAEGYPATLKPVDLLLWHDAPVTFQHAAISSALLIDERDHKARRRFEAYVMSNCLMLSLWVFLRTVHMGENSYV